MSKIKSDVDRFFDVKAAKHADFIKSRAHDRGGKRHAGRGGFHSSTKYKRGSKYPEDYTDAIEEVLG